MYLLSPFQNKGKQRQFGNKSINTVTKQNRTLTFPDLVINSTNDLQKKLKRLVPHHLFVKTQMRCFKNCITHHPKHKVEIHSVLPKTCKCDDVPVIIIINFFFFFFCKLQRNGSED